MTGRSTHHWYAILAVVVCTFSVGCNSRQATTLPEYKIVDEEVYDAPIKTQVVQQIVVSGQITEENLRALLRQQQDKVSRQTGFKYHDSPTNIYLYVYETEDKATAGQGLWLAMSAMNHGENTPTVDVRTEQILRLGQKPEEKLGMSEAQRQILFREIARVEKRATDAAMEQFPSDFSKQVDLEKELEEKYKDELAAQYGLSRDQLLSIVVEGVKNRWRY